ncbi:TDP-4-keto-6-deoxy-D-glucose transaminase [Cucurbitaria berberidis CBS 394.84]|uniref:TDP-4-keto-6-deoxy-D-glucose transaminase n=1 Tax=Cucurbitaria berberidis CBS 394.84 TaxID=1168544 RepID=A0A9P4GCU7_9PLEO|nr:TDP-4-keto-6-deoxy-D-glucose transaminase [Cucurbitaria berberidis CBS 394.84]KAF1843287.1 TDP-4-keto-6-deoxy-D-glucose transaminase [Cucurbitaria berberidis CBS 394.84]
MELSNVRRAAFNGATLPGGGEFTDRVVQLLESQTENSTVFLTNSCTRALEMAALICDLEPGDEVIAPSYTFVSTINAFLLRGARIVFVDIDKTTMNIDTRLIEAAVTNRTKVIVPMHYGGIGCDMDTVMDIANRHKLLVVEDAAQCPNATWKGKQLGSFGHIGCMSFHGTKNITAGGQGGAVFINDPSLVAQAEIVYDNGTNRQAFFRGETSNGYEWKSLGSNFALCEVQAAYLWAQIDQATKIVHRRLQIWNAYHNYLQPLVQGGKIEVMKQPPESVHNAHIFWLKLINSEKRGAFGKFMKEKGISTTTHFTPLHKPAISTKLGCRFYGEDRYTSQESSRLTRLPLFYKMTDEEVGLVLNAVYEFFGESVEDDLSNIGNSSGTT